MADRLITENYNPTTVEWHACTIQAMGKHASYWNEACIPEMLHKVQSSDVSSF